MANCIAGDYQNETYDRKCHGSVFIESLITLLYSVFYLNCICNLYSVQTECQETKFSDNTNITVNIPVQINRDIVAKTFCSFQFNTDQKTLNESPVRHTFIHF